MRLEIESLVGKAIAEAVATGELALTYTPECAVERPRDPTHGDWASTIALKLAKELGRSPRDIAQVIAERVALSEMIAAVEVAGPGFINIRLAPVAFQRVVHEAFEQGFNFARLDIGKGRRLNIEFISANPTGPMHVGHGRWAALGNALCNVCEHAGWHVTREFYINDAGHQMDVFGQSVALRYRELQGEKIEIPEEFYGGSYVTSIAQQIADDGGHDASDVEYFRERGYQLMLARMQDVCTRVGVDFDVWFSERQLYADNNRLSSIQQMLAKLKAGGYLYEKEGATWFRTTDFADDKDRVLIKSDGSYTYFAPDIAYHLNKFERNAGDLDEGSPAGSDYLVNIWGADHHGYIPRMQAAVTALGHEGRLTVVLGQLVNLYRAGEAVRMSKRTGEMVTFEELIEEVGPDATKYLMLSRSSDQPIDFDIEAAKKQDSSNPVYYVQYAHARICSLIRKSEVENPDIFIAAVGLNSAPDLTLLKEEAELDLARELARLSEVVEAAVNDLAPVRLTHYAQELARAFHDFYTRCPVLTAEGTLAAARLYLAAATRNVLALTLSLLGVSAPEKM